MWDYIKQGDFVSLSETWVEEKKLENKLPRNFVRKVIPARREARKGRAKGGFLIGIKKDWANGDSILMQEIEEGLIETVLENGEEKLYNTENMERYYGHWEKKNRDQDVRIILGGDFNIRLGGEGSLVGADGKIGEKEFRASKDKVVSNGGNKLTEFCGREGWSILNGNLKGDKKGEYTYIGPRGSTVIDYIIVNEKMRKLVVDFQVEERIESDHAPICTRVNVTEKETSEECSSEAKEDTTKFMYVWSEEALEIFRSKTAELEIEEREEDSVETRWYDTKRIIEEAVTKKNIKIKKWKLGQKNGGIEVAQKRRGRL